MNADDAPTDPAELYDLGRVLSPWGPHGPVVRAAVSSRQRDAIDVTSVAVKIIPVGAQVTAVLLNTVESLRGAALPPTFVRYYGVHASPRGDAWLISDLCEGGSLPDVLCAAQITDRTTRERIVAHALRTSLVALDALHASGRTHGDVRARNVLVDHRGRVRLGDHGVYHVLEAALRRRTAYAGARLCPAPELSAGAYDARAEVHAVGVVAAELMDGRARVFRRAAPHVARCSAAMQAFVEAACRRDPAARPTAAQLLQTAFVAGADGGALAAAAAKAAARPTPPGLAEGFDEGDVVGRLHRRNDGARVPLVRVRELDAAEMVKGDARAREETPAVEGALKNVLEARRRADRGKDGAGRVEAIVETIDYARRMR